MLPLTSSLLARVLTGSTLSPLGQLAERAVAPRLGPPSYVAGPPTRSAQGIGAMVAVAAAVARAVGATSSGRVPLLRRAVIATPEAALGVRAGCLAFAQLTRHGVPLTRAPQ